MNCRKSGPGHILGKRKTWPGNRKRKNLYTVLGGKKNKAPERVRRGGVGREEKGKKNGASLLGRKKRDG